ncbi:MAG: sugar isomerase [Cyclobacteriaceae bacterium]|nr:sugar isomerase [Cyclobacteriaceae bacterium]
MKLERELIFTHNEKNGKKHGDQFQQLTDRLTGKGLSVEQIIKDLGALQIAIPSWALGTGGTRFGRFPGGGEPGSLEEKIEDVGLLHSLNRSSGAISLHIPWDIPDDYQDIRNLASSFGLKFDAVNSNTFQDQPGQEHSYKFGSLCHADPHVRKQAIAHNKEVIDHGIKLGSESITVWLADGSSYPGQHNFRKALLRSLDSLSEIYQYLPENWKMFVEYKPFEPGFYSMVIPDWGTSYYLSTQLGPNAYSLVDLGHHLPNTNIEQVVATLMMTGKLGGFHFNDSKFADDDLTVGAIKPYQLFLIFNELVYGMHNNESNNPSLAWMIDASHNIKDPLEDLLQSVEAIKIAYAQALIVNRELLEDYRDGHDVVMAQELLQDVFRTDVRPLVAESRIRENAAFDPVGLYRELQIRKRLIGERGKKTIATGL